mmetsp:Transcript_5314/g.13218  ORF Transcript_5314/g.13218 Transcript_5314/m.13218 type:complete len:232 (+) Transcript_5314:471-1166(+)
MARRCECEDVGVQILHEHVIPLHRRLFHWLGGGALEPAPSCRLECRVPRRQPRGDARSRLHDLSLVAEHVDLEHSDHLVHASHGPGVSRDLACGARAFPEWLLVVDWLQRDDRRHGHACRHTNQRHLHGHVFRALASRGGIFLRDVHSLCAPTLARAARGGLARLLLHSRVAAPAGSAYPDRPRELRGHEDGVGPSQIRGGRCGSRPSDADAVMVHCLAGRRFQRLEGACG